jgi:hypothetical protein
MPGWVARKSGQFAVRANWTVHSRDVAVAWYTFSDTRRLVRNEIQSRFTFQDGRISTQQDDCDPKKWAAMAIGGIKGFVAGRSENRRRKTAQEKLDRYVERKRLAGC